MTLQADIQQIISNFEKNFKRETEVEDSQFDAIMAELKKLQTTINEHPDSSVSKRLIQSITENLQQLEQSPHNIAKVIAAFNALNTAIKYCDTIPCLTNDNLINEGTISAAERDSLKLQIIKLHLCLSEDLDLPGKETLDIKEALTTQINGLLKHTRTILVDKNRDDIIQRADIKDLTYYLRLTTNAIRARTIESITQLNEAASEAKQLDQLRKNIFNCMFAIGVTLTVALFLSVMAIAIIFPPTTTVFPVIFAIGLLGMIASYPTGYFFLRQYIPPAVISLFDKQPDKENTQQTAPFQMPFPMIGASPVFQKLGDCMQAISKLGLFSHQPPPVQTQKPGLGSEIVKTLRYMLPR